MAENTSIYLNYVFTLKNNFQKKNVYICTYFINIVFPRLSSIYCNYKELKKKQTKN